MQSIQQNTTKSSHSKLERLGLVAYPVTCLLLSSGVIACVIYLLLTLASLFVARPVTMQVAAPEPIAACAWIPSHGTSAR